MNIHDFEMHVPKTERKTGRDYFGREKVMEILEIAPGQWTASMMGKRLYKIQVNLADDEIVAASCPCEAFKPSAYCKHVIALLYAIQYNKGLISDADAYAGSDPGSLGGKKTKDADKKEMTVYAKQIREEFTRLRDYSGHIYRDQTSQALKKPNQLLEQAAAALKANEFNKAANITLTVIEAVKIGSDKLEHGFDSTQPLFDTAFDILNNICAQEPGKSLLDRIYEHGIHGADQIPTDFKFYEYRWLELLINNKFDSIGNQNEISTLITKHITWTNERGMVDSLRKLVDFKIKLLKKYGREIEAQKLQSEYPPTNYSATDMMSGSVKNPVYLAARQRFEKEMKEYRQAGNTLKYMQTRYALLQFMIGQRDHLAVRELATQYFTENPKQNYLDIIKKTYTKAEWKKVADQYEQQLTKKN